MLTNTNPKFQINLARNGQYYWTFKAANGEILCTSETYLSEQSAKNGILSLIKNVKIYY